MTSTAQITRYDRNLATNLISFDQYGDDAVLIKNIAHYLAYEWQRQTFSANLFGKTAFDPVKFAEVMTYGNYRSLLNIHKNPLQFLNKSSEEIKRLKGGHQDRNKQPVWDTVLCNALYTMFSRPLILTFGGKTPEGINFSRLEQLTFFKDITKYRHPVTGKIYYEYELSSEFKNNLARYFFKLDTFVFAKLRHHGLQDLYIKLMYAKETATFDKDTIILDNMTFDSLCNIVNTHCAEFSDNKKYINKAFSHLNTIIGYRFAVLTWKKPTHHKFLSKPIIELFRQDNEKQQITNDHHERFKLYTIQNLRTLFRKISPFSDNEKQNVASFKEWLSHGDTNFQEKWIAIRDAYALCYGTQIEEDYLYKTHNYFANKFPSEIK